MYFLLKSKKTFFIFKFFIILLFIFYFVFSTQVFAGLFDSTPQLVSKLTDAFESIKKWLITLLGELLCYKHNEVLWLYIII